MKHTHFFISLLIGLLAESGLMAVHATGVTKVGTPRGEFAVSPLGGATYSVAIDCPPGINGMEPQIALCYNSQSGYGLAGYGVNISGISAITRGPMDMYHDGRLSGITYSYHGDALYLDGKRLIPSYFGSSSYTVEGDPYMEVMRYGSIGEGVTDFWYEVKDRHTGMIYKYGATADSRQIYTNKDGISHVGSWYISSAEDVNSNYITYAYSQSNLCVRPLTISYGMNRNAGRNYQLNRIEFEYEALGVDACPFVIEDAKGQLDFRLKNVRSTTYGSTYRRYDLTYSTTIDSSWGKFARLTSITEKNDDGEAMNPVSFYWNALPSAYISLSTLNISMEDSNPNVQRLDMQLVNSDLNSDGVDEVIRISTVSMPNGFGGTDEKVFLYISESDVSQNGVVSFNPPYTIDLGRFGDGRLRGHPVFGGIYPIDLNGDGFKDLLVPDYSVDNDGKKVGFNICYGKICGDSTIPTFVRHYREMPDNATIPLMAISDLNGDGKDDVIMLHTTKQNSLYPLHVVMNVDTDESVTDCVFSANLPKTPKRIYAADFNNDGLKDLIVFHEDGYKIFLNQGNFNPSSMFSNLYYISGTSVCDSWRMEPGDFNGDGLLDFVFNIKSETTLKFALNNGDGTFDVSEAYDLGFCNHGATGDDTRYALLASDLDHDGRSDVVVAKAHYHHHGGLNPHDSYTQTYVRWLYSTGNALTLFKSVNTHGEDDALEGLLVFGDFDGDGCEELLSYGNSLIANSSTDNPALHLYKTGTDMANKGKVRGVTDGLGRTIDISYAALSNPTVYQMGTVTAYPLVEPRIPLHVVSSVTRSNGAAGVNTETFQYKGLKTHIVGKGLLGFEKNTADNGTLGTRAVSTVVQWDTLHWVPLQTRSEKMMGSDTTTIATTFTTLLANQNSMACPQTVIVTDADGNVSQTNYTYDAAKGVPLTVTESNDNGSFWKSKIYTDYYSYKGRYLPWTVTYSSKHPDDASTFTQTTTCRYDSCGRVSKTVEHHGTPMALTTDYTYDLFGNQLSSVQSGANVTPITTVNTYDYYGRFLTDTYTNPQTTSTVYTYDTWGNLIRRAIYNTYIQITDYSYDSWGTLLAETSPHNIVTTYEEGWGTTAAKCYYRRQSKPGQPWVKVWYDEQGREVERESIGQSGMAVSRQMTYDSRGNVTATACTTGSLTLTEASTYDNRNRMVSNVHSSGRTSTYSYGNRMVTTTLNGHEYTKTYDAWGNTVTSADTLTTVSYTYYSSGLPATATSCGSTVQMQYDVAGHRILLSDPDAGITTCTYSADGKLLSQTDARGITTTYTYDALGNTTTQQVGNMTVNATYGTSGSRRLLPQQITMGGNSITYTYDSDDRITAEQRSFADGTQLNYAYTYNDMGQLTQRTMPGGLIVGYSYDSYGFLTAMTAAGQQVYTHVVSDGTRDSSLFCGSSQRVAYYDNNGNLRKKQYTNAGICHDLGFSFNGATGNLLSRSRDMRLVIIDPGPMQPNSAGTLGHGGGGAIVDPGIVNPVYPFTTESFTYDALDRLVATSKQNTQFNISYAANGNILSKSGVGDYSYSGNSAEQPHAVLSVTNSQGNISLDTLLTTFNDLGKISTIGQGSLETTFTYGPDMERWKSVTTDSTATTRIVRYGADHERVTQGSTVRDLYYLGHDVIVMRQDSGAFTPLLTVTDNLGSIYYLNDASGNVKFSADYDAWGQPAVHTNSIGFQRGYCGHEMLCEYGLINMNGRLYDPLLGRFLSPDNYVQAPESSQSFNRYSYCMNNPLKYVDPDGEWFLHSLVSGLIRGIVKLASGHGHWYSPFYGAYKNIANDVKIKWGLFKGSPKQILSRFTWELPQTFLGYEYSNYRLIVSDIEKVKYFDGATYVINQSNATTNGVTLGNYININTQESIPIDSDGRFAPYTDGLFAHEYGHYLQSQRYGLGYLFSHGIPSIISAIKSKNKHETYKGNKYSKHNVFWTERDSNKKASVYFIDHGYIMSWLFVKYPL